MTELSPAAQAVLDAYKNAPDLTLDGDPDEVERRLGLAAALRATADQLGYFNVPEEFAHMRSKVVDVDDLLAIADELESQ